jgi:hypothetical protein
VVRYDRLNDRSKPDHAEIRESCNVFFGPGEIDLVKPYEIHTEITVGERTVAVIIRSQKGGEFRDAMFRKRIVTMKAWDRDRPLARCCQNTSQKDLKS